MNLRRFKIHRSYSMSFNLSDVGEFFWSWILRAVTDFEKKKRKANRSFVFTCSAKREVRHFHVVVFSRTAEKCTKKRAASAKVCFANLNLLLLCRSHCRRRHIRRTTRMVFFFSQNLKENHNDLSVRPVLTSANAVKVWNIRKINFVFATSLA